MAFLGTDGVLNVLLKKLPESYPATLMLVPNLTMEFGALFANTGQSDFCRVLA